MSELQIERNVKVLGSPIKSEANEVAHSVHLLDSRVIHLVTVVTIAYSHGYKERGKRQQAGRQAGG